MAWQSDAFNQHPEQERAARWLDDVGERALEDCLPLDRDDLVAIGMLVQVMAASDSHARRAIEALDTAMKRPRREARKDYRDTDVCKEVRQRLRDAQFELRSRMRGDEVIAFLDSTGWYRNVVAHWPGRRIPNVDCCVFVTKNAREALRKSGVKLDLYEMRYAVLYCPQLFALINDARNAVDEFGSILTMWIDDMDRQSLLPPGPFAGR